MSGSIQGLEHKRGRKAKGWTTQQSKGMVRLRSLETIRDARVLGPAATNWVKQEIRKEITELIDMWNRRARR